VGTARARAATPTCHRRRAREPDGGRRFGDQSEVLAEAAVEVVPERVDHAEIVVAHENDRLCHATLTPDCPEGTLSGKDA
jgi:hypothetical protein